MYGVGRWCDASFQHLFMTCLSDPVRRPWRIELPGHRDMTKTLSQCLLYSVFYYLGRRATGVSGTDRNLNAVMVRRYITNNAQFQYTQHRYFRVINPR